MKQYCNLCGKKMRYFKKCLEHGQSRFHMCRCCFAKLTALWDQGAHEKARSYLEEKMLSGRNERMNLIIRSKILNTDLERIRDKKEEMENEEENTCAALIQSAGILGGGVLFLLGICMLNIHVKIAAMILITAVILGIVLYGAGLMISFILHFMHRRQ